MSDTMKLAPIRKHLGVAGNIAYSTSVTFPGEPPASVTFHGSVYGGPVVMATAAGQTFVTDPGRFGAFGVEWVARFFGETR